MDSFKGGEQKETPSPCHGAVAILLKKTAVIGSGPVLGQVLRPLPGVGGPLIALLAVLSATFLRLARHECVDDLRVLRCFMGDCLVGRRQFEQIGK